jgi:hypothetical protein
MTPPYVSNRGRAILTAAFLGICVVLSVVQALAHYGRMLLIKTVMAHGTWTQLQLQTADDRVAHLAVAWLVVYVLTGISFLMWIYRAYKNMLSLGAEGYQFTPWWAVGGWFVPYLNLFRPYQVIKELWQTSDPDATADSAAWQSGRTPPLLLVWWVLWLSQTVLSQVVSTLNKNAKTAAAFVGYERWAIGTEVASVAGALLALFLVVTIDRRQTERRRQLEAAGKVEAALP